MFNRRTLLFGVAALALLALGVTAGKGGGGGKPPPPPPPPADPAILFQLPAADGSGGWELWVMNEDGSNQTPVITYATHGLYVRGPQSWSGDNSRFLFFGRPVVAGQPLNLYVADSNGSNVTMILEGLDPLNLALDADWSRAPLPGQAAADEWIILNAFEPDDYGADLFAVRSDGTGLAQLTDTQELHESSPQITPDGKCVLFTRETGLVGVDYPNRVFKGTLGTDATTGLPTIVDEECITELPGSPLASKKCALISLDPTGTHALVAQGYYLRQRWILPLADPTAAWLTSLTEVVAGPWLDPATVVYSLKDQKQKEFIAKTDVFAEQEAIIASFGKTPAILPIPRRWAAGP